jgi:hypothetical protein
MVHKYNSRRNIIRCFSLFVLLVFLSASFSTAMAKSAKTIQVPATVQWVNTGIYVKTGQKVTIQAKGVASTLKTNPKSKSGPNGQKWNRRCGTVSTWGSCAMNGAAYGALVGKIGNGTSFLLGAKKTFTAKSSGTLYLSVNDNLQYYYDNQGGYAVTISTP